MTHEGDTVDIEHGEQVAHAVREGRQRVVGARFVGLAVTQQVRCNDRKPLRKFGVHGAPRRGVVTDTVNQQQGGP